MLARLCVTEGVSKSLLIVKAILVPVASVAKASSFDIGGACFGARCASVPLFEAGASHAVALAEDVPAGRPFRRRGAWVRPACAACGRAPQLLQEGRLGRRGRRARPARGCSLAPLTLRLGDGVEEVHHAARCCRHQRALIRVHLGVNAARLGRRVARGAQLQERSKTVSKTAKQKASRAAWRAAPRACACGRPWRARAPRAPRPARARRCGCWPGWAPAARQPRPRLRRLRRPRDARPARPTPRATRQQRSSQDRHACVCRTRDSAAAARRPSSSSSSSEAAPALRASSFATASANLAPPWPNGVPLSPPLPSPKQAARRQRRRTVRHARKTCLRCACRRRSARPGRRLPRPRRPRRNRSHRRSLT